MFKISRNPATKFCITLKKFCTKMEDLENSLHFSASLHLRRLFFTFFLRTRTPTPQTKKTTQERHIRLKIGLSALSY